QQALLNFYPEESFMRTESQVPCPSIPLPVSADTVAALPEESPNPETKDNCTEFKDAASMQQEYEQLDVEIHKDCYGLTQCAAQTEELRATLIPHLSEMQELLSQRGRNYKIARELNLPEWSAYLAQVAQ